MDQIEMLKDNMEYMLQELEQSRNSKHWHKLDFNTWYGKMTNLCKMEAKKMGKADESIITNLVETNVYLMRKLSKLETKMTTPAQNPP